MSDNYEPRLKKKYKEQIRTKLQEEFKYSNEMQVPKLDKAMFITAMKARPLALTFGRT